MDGCCDGAVEMIVNDDPYRAVAIEVIVDNNTMNERLLAELSQ